MAGMGHLGRICKDPFSWQAQFYSDVENKWLRLVPYNATATGNHFLEADRDACLRLRTHAVQLYDSMTKLFAWSDYLPSRCLVFVFSDGTKTHQQPNSSRASVCVFSDRTMAHQHLEFVAGQRVCLFWPHDCTSALGIHCTPTCLSFLTARWHISTWNSLQASVCVFSDRTIAHQHSEFVARQRVCLFWQHDSTSAFGVRCTPPRRSCLPARWHISIRKPLPGLVSVFSDGAMAHASTAAAEDSCPLLLGKNKLLRHREADTPEGWVPFLHVFLYHHNSGLYHYMIAVVPILYRRLGSMNMSMWWENTGRPFIQYVGIMMIWFSSYEWCVDTVDAWFLVMSMSIFT